MIRSHAVPQRGSEVRAACLHVTACALVLAVGCGSELGTCDSAAANELVYSRSGLVATKGQAIAHDSCGNGAFCHSSAASGSERHGAPKKLDFDMLPVPRGLSMMRDWAEDSWTLIKSGEMPPSGVGNNVQGDNDWRADLLRAEDAPRLPALGTAKGMAVMRNWLACGAPVVRETAVPPGLQPMSGGFTMAGAVPTFAELHAQIFLPSCATAGCHTSSNPAGGLPLEELCAADTALRKTGDCGKVSVVADDIAGSFLVEKLESTTPSCGAAMPPTGMLPEAMRVAVRAWIAAGAEGPSCP